MSKGQTADRQFETSNRPSLDTSILFQFHAIWVLLFILLAATWYRFVSLIVVSAFLLFLFIAITLWKKASLNHIQPNLKLSKARLFVDEDFLIHASVYNGKWLPLVWLEWVFSENTGVSYENAGANAYTVRFLWVLWFRRVEWALTGRALQRGVYNLGQVILRSGDGFRFAETEKEYRLEEKLYVYPKIIPVHVPNLKPSMYWGIRGRQGGFIEDPLMVIGTREYQAGDEWKRLNWKASARTGKLLTNVYQPIVMEQLVIYIDVSGFVIIEKAYEDPDEQKAYAFNKRKDFEKTLSVIASVGLKYKEKGVGIGFSSNALNYCGEKMPNILPGTDLTPFLDRLAQITQRVGVPRMVSLDEMNHKGQLYMPVFVFCHHIKKEHYTWFQIHKNKVSDISFFYKKETEYSKKLDANAKQINLFLASNKSV